MTRLPVIGVTWSDLQNLDQGVEFAGPTIGRRSAAGVLPHSSTIAMIRTPEPRYIVGPAYRPGLPARRHDESAGTVLASREYCNRLWALSTVCPPSSSGQ